MIEPYYTYTKIFIGIIAAMAIYSFGYKTGKANAQHQFDEYVHNQEEAEHEALIERLKFNEAVSKRHKEENQQLKDSYDKEIAKLRGDVARISADRLRVPKAACGGSTSTTKATSTGGSNEGTTEGWELSAETSTAFRQYALDADEIVASCRALQKFVTTNGMAP